MNGLIVSELAKINGKISEHNRNVESFVSLLQKISNSLEKLVELNSLKSYTVTHGGFSPTEFNEEEKAEK